MQKVLVTGASGFIGSHLVGELVQRGMHCCCLVRSQSRGQQLREMGAECIEGDIRHPESYRAHLANCDTVFHLAGLIHALSYEAMHDVNGVACGQLADACRAANSATKLVVVSSLAAVGPPLLDQDLRIEADEPTPISEYGRSKRAGETELQKRAGDIPITVIRPGIVFGPRDTSCLDIYRSIHRYRLHITIGYRTPPLSMIYVEDLVDLILSTAQQGETLQGDPGGEYSSEGYYFACDDSAFPNYREFGQMVAKSIDRAVLVWPLWRWVGRLAGHSVQGINRLRGRSSMLNADKIREATVRSWASSCEKARHQLGFAPAQSLETRLRQTGDWYAEHGWL